jgi:hypothetical protein
MQTSRFFGCRKTLNLSSIHAPQCTQYDSGVKHVPPFSKIWTGCENTCCKLTGRADAEQIIQTLDALKKPARRTVDLRPSGNLEFRAVPTRKSLSGCQPQNYKGQCADDIAGRVF